LANNFQAEKFSRLTLRIEKRHPQRVAFLLGFTNVQAKNGGRKNSHVFFFFKNSARGPLHWGQEFASYHLMSRNDATSQTGNTVSGETAFCSAPAAFLKHADTGSSLLTLCTDSIH